MLRVLIADDHPLIRIGVVKLLTEARAEVEEVASIPELRGTLAKTTPDVLILDWHISGGDSLEEVREFRRLYPALAILVLSTHSERQAGVRALFAGANGYLSKGSPPEELVNAVHEVAKGGRYISPAMGAALADYVVRTHASKAPHEALSAREHTVLLRIARGYTTAEIAHQLQLSPKTVGTYRARVLEKMAISTTAELTRYVVQKGLDED